MAVKIGWTLADDRPEVFCASPSDLVEVFVKGTPLGARVFAIRGRANVPTDQLTASWSFGGVVNTPFYARVQPGTKISHAVFLLQHGLPKGETPGLTPDGYGILEFFTDDIERLLATHPENQKIRLY